MAGMMMGSMVALETMMMRNMTRGYRRGGTHVLVMGNGRRNPMHRHERRFNPGPMHGAGFRGHGPRGGVT